MPSSLCVSCFAGLLAGVPELASPEELEAADWGASQEAGGGAPPPRRMLSAFEQPQAAEGYLPSGGIGGGSGAAAVAGVRALWPAFEHAIPGAVFARSGGDADLLLRVPARDLSDQAQSMFNGQLGIPRPVEVAAYAALAAFGLVSAALAIMIYQQRLPTSTLKRLSQLSVLKRPLRSLERALSLHQLSGSGFRPAAAATSAAAPVATAAALMAAASGTGLNEAPATVVAAAVGDDEYATATAIKLPNKSPAAAAGGRRRRSSLGAASGGY